MRHSQRQPQRPENVYIQHGNPPNHEHVQQRTRVKCHGKKKKRHSRNREQELGTVSLRTGTQQIPREDNAAEDGCKLNEKEEGKNVKKVKKYPG